MLNKEQPLIDSFLTDVAKVNGEIRSCAQIDCRDCDYNSEYLYCWEEGAKDVIDIITEQLYYFSEKHKGV